ncbi:unnamed protein product [Urochloa decumbens]|uniref:At1g61320/AtMIF1 LRR domain-containing protein n=1 Tax=Urochloa decumbens TaxID=240449 RepID=A0ABC9G704_9POAL
MAALIANTDQSSSSSSDGRDRLSELPDHLLLVVLDKVRRDDVRLAARTCVLSKRWRGLPLMLPRLVLRADSFLPVRARAGSVLPMRRLHQATAKFADALRFFLATDAGGQRHIRRLTLHFPLIKRRRRLHEIGRLVSAAAGRGEVGALEVTLDTVEGTPSIRRDGGDAVARGYARRFMRLFRAAPAVLVGSALRKLWLRNLCFRRAADPEGVLRACAALETLQLTYCWFAAASPLRVDAGPRSRLRELAVEECCVERVHVVQAPELRHLTCANWFSHQHQACACPVTFAPGSAPSLKKMTLTNRSAPGQLSCLKLSDLLENANPVEDLRLDFHHDRVWVQPENRSDLAVALSNLKRLRVSSMMPGSGISWTMFLVKAAPLLESFDIHVSPEPVCGSDDDDRGGAHRDLEWDAPPEHFERRHLRTVEIRGGIDPGRHAGFVRLVLERAVNLELLVLDARITCADCLKAKERDPSLVLSEFPEDKDGIDAFVRELRDGIPTSAQIILRSPCNQEFEYLN